MKNRIIHVYFLIAIWIAIFVLSQFMDWPNQLVGVGIELIHGEAFRYITASFVHRNPIHLIANCLALYFGTIYLDGKIKGSFLTILVIIAATVANAIFSIIYPRTLDFYGGSTIIFASYGLIIAMQFTCKDIEKFRLGTWYGNWSLCYLILGNLFNGNLEFGDFSPIVIHGLSFIVGAILGTIGTHGYS